MLGMFEELKENQNGWHSEWETGDAVDGGNGPGKALYGRCLVDDKMSKEPAQE